MSLSGAFFPTFSPLRLHACAHRSLSSIMLWSMIPPPGEVLLTVPTLGVPLAAGRFWASRLPGPPLRPGREQEDASVPSRPGRGIIVRQFHRISTFSF